MATRAARAFLPGCARRSSISSCQVLRGHGIDVMTECLELGDQALGQILVKLDVHRMGDSATGRSSWADVAANAMAARTSSSHNVGKSARISAVVAPSARLASTVLRVTRVPLSTGWPPTTLGS